jgi:hypothetical protein
VYTVLDRDKGRVLFASVLFDRNTFAKLNPAVSDPYELVNAHFEHTVGEGAISLSESKNWI